MPSENDPSAAGQETAGPDSGEDTSVGVVSDGADDSGQEAGQGDEKSPESPSTHDQSSEDALLEALANGKMDGLDPDGNAKKAAKATDDEPAEDTDQKETEPEKDAAAEKPAESKPDEVPDDEKKLLEKARTKGERRELDKLFKERREIKTTLSAVKGFADGVAQHAESAGLVRRTDKGLDTSGLYNLIETEKRVQALAPKDQAAYYRSLAEKLYPDIPKAAPTPVELPAELKDAVDAGYLKADEAALIAQKRQPPKAEEKQPETKVETPPPAPSGPSPEAIQKGYASIAEVAKGFKQRFAADWESMAEKVQQQIQPLLKAAPPEAWKGIAELAMKAEAAERKQVVKKPLATTRPSGQPPKRTDATLSEDEELEALARGKRL